MQEELRFSPSELVFDLVVRDTLKILKKTWLFEEESSMNLLEYASTFQYQLSTANELAKENLKYSQSKMRSGMIRKPEMRNSSLVIKCMLYFPLLDIYCRHNTTDLTLSCKKWVTYVDYIVTKQNQLCHVNMLRDIMIRQFRNNHWPPYQYVALLWVKGVASRKVIVTMHWSEIK